jgi:hypothetical protein
MLVKGAIEQHVNETKTVMPAPYQARGKLWQASRRFALKDIKKDNLLARTIINVIR